MWLAIVGWLVVVLFTVKIGVASYSDYRQSREKGWNTTVRRRKVARWSWVLGLVGIALVVWLTPLSWFNVGCCRALVVQGRCLIGLTVLSWILWSVSFYRYPGRNRR